MNYVKYLGYFYFPLPHPHCLGQLIQTDPLLYILHHLHTHMHIVAQNKVGLESYIWYSVIFQFLSRHGIDSLRLLLLLYKNTDTRACVCVCACTLAVLPYFGDSGSFSINSGLQIPSLTHLSIHLPALHTQSMKLLLHTPHKHDTRHTVTTHTVLLYYCTDLVCVEYLQSLGCSDFESQ